MEFGLCTNFAAEEKDPVGRSLLETIRRAGFSYVELPLCQVAALSEREFEALLEQLDALELKTPAVCNLFPEDMCLRGGGEDIKGIRAYLEHALARAARLKVRKVVFASVSAWNTTGSIPQARRELVRLVREEIAPLCRKYGIRLLMEGIRNQVCNVLNTLPEAGALARQAEHPSCGLMADLYHMLCNEEPAAHLAQWAGAVEHVHIADKDRLLPGGEMSESLNALIAQLGRSGYDGQISFEVRGPLEPEALIQARKIVEHLLH